MKKLFRRLYVAAIYLPLLAFGVVIGAVLGAVMGITGTTVPLWNEFKGAGNA